MVCLVPFGGDDIICQSFVYQLQDTHQHSCTLSALTVTPETFPKVGLRTEPPRFFRCLPGEADVDGRDRRIASDRTGLEIERVEFGSLVRCH